MFLGSRRYGSPVSIFLWYVLFQRGNVVCRIKSHCVRARVCVCRQLDYNNLTEVSKGWLYGLKSLQQLHLSHNTISKIKSDAWEPCPKLSELWVHLFFSAFPVVPLDISPHFLFTLWTPNTSPCCPLLLSGTPACPSSHSSSSRCQYTPNPSHTHTHTRRQSSVSYALPVSANIKALPKYYTPLCLLSALLSLEPKHWPLEVLLVVCFFGNSIISCIFFSLKYPQTWFLKPSTHVPASGLNFLCCGCCLQQWPVLVFAMSGAFFTDRLFFLFFLLPPSLSPLFSLLSHKPESKQVACGLWTCSAILICSHQSLLWGKKSLFGVIHKFFFWCKIWSLQTDWR